VTSPPSQPPRTINDLAALGQRGPAWEFLVHAQASPDAVAQVPAIRFLVALNLARLGLKELAQPHLDLLDAPNHPDVVAVAGAIAALPASRIDPAALLTRARDAAATLGPRLALPSSVMHDLGAMLTRVDVHAARDGNIVMRPASGLSMGPAAGQASGVPGSSNADLTQCSTLADINAVMTPWQARRDGGASSDAASNIGFAYPVVVDGMLPPTVALAVWRATSTPYLGHTPRVYLVSADPVEHVLGLAIALWLDAASAALDVATFLRDARVEHFAGEIDGRSAADRLGARLRERLDLAMPVTVVTAPLTPTLAGPLAAVQGARREQADLRTRLAQELGDAHETMTPTQWRERLLTNDADAMARPGANVLIPTSRYTTYLQHTSKGLADALARAGLTPHLHIEPDGHSVFDPVARLVAIRDAKPDLVIRINSPRMHGTDAASEPATRVPTVTWVQDAMPHLFDTSMGASMGPLEVLVGCRVPELVRVFGYPRDRSEAMPVVADEARFNAAAAHRTPSRDDLECEIAYASHHAATTMELHEKIAADSPANVRPILERVYPHALIYAADPFARPLKQYLRGAARDALRECLGIEPDAAMMAKITNSYAMAIADRALRHRVLEFAANLATRRGWRLRIFGNGWDKHPTLSAFARPSLAHDTDLAHSYARAKVHLHISHHGPLHQRVFECALSGGLPAVLVTPAFVSALWAWAVSEPTDAGSKLAMNEPIAHSWACMAASACTQRLGLTQDAWYPREGLAKHALAPEHIPDTERAARDLPLAIAESAFLDEAGLERVVDRAIASATWRASASNVIAWRVRERLTQDALVRTMFGVLRRAVDRACERAETHEAINPASAAASVATSVAAAPAR
jgi:hypothetical protein